MKSSPGRHSVVLSEPEPSHRLAVAPNEIVAATPVHNVFLGAAAQKIVSSAAVDPVAALAAGQLDPRHHRP